MNMELGSAAINNKIKGAIIKQLQTVGCYVDDELPQYIMVMVANNRIQTDREEMVDNLNLFLNDEADEFVLWLSELLAKVKEAMQSPNFDICDLDLEDCNSQHRKSSYRKITTSDGVRNGEKHERKRNIDELHRSMSSKNGLNEEREAKKRVERSHRERRDNEGKENRRTDSKCHDLSRKDMKDDVERNPKNSQINETKDNLDSNEICDQGSNCIRPKMNEHERETTMGRGIQVIGTNNSVAKNKAIETDDTCHQIRGKTERQDQEPSSSNREPSSSTAVMCKVDGDVDFTLEAVSGVDREVFLGDDPPGSIDNSVGIERDYAQGRSPPPCEFNLHHPINHVSSAEFSLEELPGSNEGIKDVTGDELNSPTDVTPSARVPEAPIEVEAEEEEVDQEEDDEDEVEVVRRPTVASKVIIAPKDNSSEDKEEIRRRAEEIRRRTIASSKIVEVRSDYSRQTSAEYIEDDEVELDYNETENESEDDMHENRVVNFDQEKSGLPTITVNFADNSPKYSPNKDTDKYRYSSKSSNGRCNDRGTAGNNYHCSSFLRSSNREERKGPNIDKDDFRHKITHSRSEHDVDRSDRKKRHDRSDLGERRHSSRTTEHDNRVRRHNGYSQHDERSNEMLNKRGEKHKTSNRRHTSHGTESSYNHRDGGGDDAYRKPQESSHSNEAESDLRQLLGRRDARSDFDAIAQDLHDRLVDEKQIRSKSISEQHSRQLDERNSQQEKDTKSKRRSIERDAKRLKEDKKPATCNAPAISILQESSNNRYKHDSEGSGYEASCANKENQSEIEDALKASGNLERISDVELDSEKEGEEVTSLGGTEIALTETILLDDKDGEDSVEEVVEEEVEIEVEVSDNDPAENEDDVIALDPFGSSKTEMQKMEVDEKSLYHGDELTYEPCRTPVNVTPAESSDGTPIKDEPNERRHSDKRSKRSKHSHYRKRSREQHDGSGLNHDHHRISMQEKMAKVQRFHERHPKSADHSSRRSSRHSSRNSSRNNSRHNSPDEERSWSRNRHSSSRNRTPEEKKSRSRSHSYAEKESKKHREYLHDQHEMKTTEQHCHKTQENVFRKSLEMIQNVTHHYNTSVNGDQAYSKPAYVSPNFHRLPLDGTSNRSLFPVMLGNNIPVKPLIFTAPVLRPVNLVRPLNNVQAVDKSKLHPTIMQSPSEKITLTPINLSRPMTNFVPNVSSLPQYNIMKQNTVNNADKVIVPAVSDSAQTIQVDKNSSDSVKTDLPSAAMTSLKSGEKSTVLTDPDPTDALALLCADPVRDVPIVRSVSSEPDSKVIPQLAIKSVPQLPLSNSNLHTRSVQEPLISARTSQLSAETETQLPTESSHRELRAAPVTQFITEQPSSEVELPTEPILPFLTDTASQLSTLSDSAKRKESPEHLSTEMWLQTIKELGPKQLHTQTIPVSSSSIISQADTISKNLTKTELQAHFEVSDDRCVVAENLPTVKRPSSVESQESVKGNASDVSGDNDESTEDDDDSESADSGSSDDSDDSNDDDDDDGSSDSSGSDEELEGSQLCNSSKETDQARHTSAHKNSSTVIHSSSMSTKVVTVSSKQLINSTGGLSSIEEVISAPSRSTISAISQVTDNSTPGKDCSMKVDRLAEPKVCIVPEVPSTSLTDFSPVPSSANMSGMMFALQRATMQKHMNNKPEKKPGTTAYDMKSSSLINNKSLAETPIASSLYSISRSSTPMQLINAISISSVESIVTVSNQPTIPTPVFTTKTTGSSMGSIGMSHSTDATISNKMPMEEYGTVKVHSLLHNTQSHPITSTNAPLPCLPNIPTHIQPSFVQPSGQSNHVTPHNFPALPPGAPPLPPFIPPHGIPIPPVPVIQPISQSSVPAKIQQRCQIWPECRNSSCQYVHPSENCKMFPNCVYGQSCFYIHPPCMFGEQCTNSACLFMHISTKAFSGCSSSPCKYHQNCTSGEHCPYKNVDPPKEPTRPCSFGAGKKNQTMFSHDTPQLLK